MTKHADHHILVQNFRPGGTRQHAVIVAITDFAGFDIDAATNRLALPIDRAEGQVVNRAAHPGGHLGQYFSIQRDFLDRLQRLPDFALAQAGDVAAAGGSG